MLLSFVLAVADKKTLVLDVERHMEEAQELVSVNKRNFLSAVVCGKGFVSLLLELIVYILIITIDLKDWIVLCEI
jgi:hypothetical protein